MFVVNSVYTHPLLVFSCVATMAVNADFIQERLNQLECMVKGMIQTNRNNMMLSQNQHLSDVGDMFNGLMNGAQPDQMVAKERTIQENTELLEEGVIN